MKIIKATEVLYEQHDGEIMPQKIYVIVDMKNGTLYAECDDGTPELHGTKAFDLPGYMYGPVMINEILEKVLPLATAMEQAYSDDESTVDLREQVREICDNAGLDDSIAEAQDFFASELGKKGDENSDEYWEDPGNLARMCEKFGIKAETDVKQLVERLEHAALVSDGCISYVYDTRAFAQMLIDSAREVGR